MDLINGALEKNQAIKNNLALLKQIKFKYEIKN